MKTARPFREHASKTCRYCPATVQIPELPASAPVQLVRAVCDECIGERGWLRREFRADVAAVLAGRRPAYGKPSAEGSR